MKVYEMEIDFFSTVYWGDVSINIKATSMVMLIRTFLTETTYCRNEHDITGKLNHRESVRKIWDKHKKYIETYELTFPIVTNK